TWIRPQIPVSVKNLRGTSRRPTCSCGSWLRHWYFHTQSRRSVCSIYNCRDPCEVGAHVLCDLPMMGRVEFIVPTCYDCNHPSRDDWKALKLDVGLVFVSAERTGC